MGFDELVLSIATRFSVNQEFS